MTKALVTGGAGFIGSHLCEKLCELEFDVVCMDNLFTSRRANIEHLLPLSNFEFFRHDVCEPWNLECDVIFHLACPASPVQYQRNPVNTIRTAVLGTLNVLECARNASSRIVIASTSEVYGDPTVHPQPETYFGNVNPVGIRSCYDEGKRVGESLAVSWAQQYGTSVRIARIFNTYGPRMAHDDGRLLPNLIMQGMRGEGLTVYGDGSQTRSFCYVTDTVQGLICMSEMDHVPRIVPVINIGNPDERSILSVATDVQIAFGNNPKICFKPLPEDDPKQRCPDITKAREKLGWEPRVHYGSGIEKTVEWFRNNVDPAKK
jgi:UDP-glucuronate decarboxylase